MALVVTLMATALVAALGGALLLTTTTEITIARNFRGGIEALYAADGVLEFALSELLVASDWNPFLGGLARSALVDGFPGGVRTLSGGGALDLDAVLNNVNCGKTTTCSPAEMSAVTAERPWGANNPHWQLFAHGELSALVPNAKTPFYVVVLVADDPSENDDDPLRDGTSQMNPGSGVLLLRAEAFGPWAIHKTVEVTVARTITCESPPPAGEAVQDESPCTEEQADQGSVRILSWHDMR